MLGSIYIGLYRHIFIALDVIFHAFFIPLFSPMYVQSNKTIRFNRIASDDNKTKTFDFVTHILQTPQMKVIRAQRRVNVVFV